MTLGETIRIARVTQRKSQEDLALEVGCSRMTIMNIEHGKTKKPSWELILKIAHALSLSLDSLDAPSLPRRSK